MRNLETRSGIAAAGFLALACASGVTADEFPLPEVSYSADVSLQGTAHAPDGESFSSTGRIYYADGRTRREITLRGLETVVIERPDRGVRWVLQQGMDVATEHPIDSAPRSGPPDPVFRWRRGAILEKQGSEELNGVQTDRYRVIVKNGEGIAWMTHQKVPVRYEGTFDRLGRTDALRMDFTNIEVGPQDAVLFELPDGVTPMPPVPPSTHAPGTDRKAVIEKLRKQAEEERKQYGK